MILEEPGIACIVIPRGDRTHLMDEAVMPSVLAQKFDENVVVGSYRDGKGYRYLHVPDMMKSTLDALIKRDVGTVATKAAVLVYLADDHALAPDFGDELRAVIQTGISPFDVLVPSRYADHPDRGRIQIPNGETESYCAGHCGVFRRRVIQSKPWSAQKHHRNWDLISSHDWIASGFQFVAFPKCKILDLEPEHHPWA